MQADESGQISAKEKPQISEDHVLQVNLLWEVKSSFSSNSYLFFTRVFFRHYLFYNNRFLQEDCDSSVGEMEYEIEKILDVKAFVNEGILKYKV